MRNTLRTLGVAIVLIGGLLVADPARSAPEQWRSPNVSHVAQLQWREGGTQNGTDLEFATIGGRDYAFAGTYHKGMQVIDITNPRRPSRVGVFDCGLAQGDVQVWQQGARWLASYTADNGYGSGGTCYRKLGVSRGTTGTFIADVTDPTAPKAIGFIPIILGSHNATIHPGGRFLYNSDSELPGRGQVEIWDLANPAKPKPMRTLDLFPPTAATNDAPSSPHDITFNATGTRAYVAALTYTVVVDTSIPASPTILGYIADPAITLHHQADPIEFATPAGPLTFLVVTDELGGGAENVCPGGGLHIYNVSGPLEMAPVKVGAFFAPFAGASPARACTSHVLRVHPDQQLMTIGWYGLGSRVLDISGLIGISAGIDETTGSVQAGIREVGFFRFADSDTWTAKTNRIAPDGSFFLFANDHERGLDVFRYVPPSAELQAGMDPGRWLSPAEALEEARARTRDALPTQIHRLAPGACCPRCCLRAGRYGEAHRVRSRVCRCVSTAATTRAAPSPGATLCAVADSSWLLRHLGAAPRTARCTAPARSTWLGKRAKAPLPPLRWNSIRPRRIS